MMADPKDCGLAMDAGPSFTDNLKKIGFARIKVEIDASNLLVPGILIQERNGDFWQQFQYENLPTVYFGCGRISHLDDACVSPEAVSSNRTNGSILPDNVVAAGGQESVDRMGSPVVNESADATGGRCTLLDPWLVISRIRHPRTPRAPMRGRRD